MAKNPYTGKVTTNNLIGFVDPKMGNNSVIGGGNLTDYQRKSIDEFIAKGYARVDDPTAIKNLQTLGLKLDGKPQEDWARAMAEIGASVTGPTKAEMDAARGRVDAYNAYQEYAKPKWGSIPNGDGTNRMVDVNSAEWNNYVNNFNAMADEQEQRQSRRTTPSLDTLSTAYEEVRNPASTVQSNPLDSLPVTPEPKRVVPEDRFYRGNPTFQGDPSFAKSSTSFSGDPGFSKPAVSATPGTPTPKVARSATSYPTQPKQKPVSNTTLLTSGPGVIK